MYKLLDWIDINKLNWDFLSTNPNAIDLLEKNIDKINWSNISLNINAIYLLNQKKNKRKSWFNLDIFFKFFIHQSIKNKIDWYNLS
jgi:hypothetical protein